MSRHFCCCIPVRFAVFFLTLFSFLSAGACAGFLWFITYLIDNDKLDDFAKDVNPQDKPAFDALVRKNKWGIVGAGALFTVVALFSFFGFVGSIIRNRRMVKAYSIMTIISFILGTAAAGFSLYLTFSNKTFCVDINNVETCVSNKLGTGQKVGFTVAVLIQWLIELYIVVIIRRYVEQLEEEREYRHEFRLNPTTGGTYEAKEGLLTQGHYPYSDSNNAFGPNRA
ncbi:hypothetical protein C8Q76DRAFT_763642 [Earliella scabrosa]|nr:hypothetical protein C8Q76DRAFT_763642 [Earliella scabrosa]